VWRLFLKDTRGYGTVELLILVAAAAAIAGLVASTLTPEFGDLYRRAAQSITGVCGSGF
jgi:Tfp pilus assembly protein FimT